MSAIQTVFDGEVQLLRWSETSNQGATITLQLSNAADLERFKLMTLAKGKQAGQRLMAAMVEIGEDEQPVAQPEKQSQEPKAKPGELCIMACTFCADPVFRRWITEVFNPRGVICNTEEGAKDFILETCEIDSRKKLDQFSSAAHAFHTEIRKPFLEWKEQRSARPEFPESK